MPKIEVWKCPKTKKVFFGRDEYAEHIVALRKRLNVERAWKRERALIRERVEYAVANISNTKVLAEYVKKHFHDIMIAWNASNPVIAEVIREMEMTDFHFSNMYYREHCSNSHVAPRDGVTNWGGRDENTPTGYPGFSCRVHYTVKNSPPSSDKRLKLSGGNRICVDVRNALTYIGIRTSGGSTKSTTGESTYGCTIFLSDFRAMKKAYFHAKLEDRDFIEA